MQSSTATQKGDADSATASVRKGLVLAVMSLSTFLIFLDGTVVNTALPAIARDFSASNSSLQWVVNAYSLILAGLLLAGGMIGDRFGRRRALTAGMIIFGVGAVGAALADSSNLLIVMRGVQGLGAAFALPATLSIITAVFPRGERARAIAIWTAVGSLGIVVGPALGGYLVDAVGWSAVFWLNVPVVALALAGLVVVPESRDSRGLPIDLPGAALATTGMLAVVYAVMQGGDAGWTSPSILIAALAGVILLALFVLVESRCLRSGRGPRLGVECLSSGGGVAVAMGVARTKEASRQIAMVCLDELVSEDDRFRRIDELVGDWGFVREAACPYYADGLGRPSIDPTVLL